MTDFHKSSGVSKTDWVKSAINEARVDPIGFWALVQDGQYGFDLEGDALEAFLRRTIVSLVDAGAMTVVGDRQTKRWRKTDEYGRSASEVADAVVQEWQSSNKQTDVGGVWFAFSTAIDERT